MQQAPAGGRRTTSGTASDFVQANLIVVPAAYAAELRLLCARNPVPCPLIEALEPGAYEPRCAPGADLRRDIPGYRVWRDGRLVERRTDVVDLWTDDVAAFLIGCSFTFEAALIAAGLTIRHQQLGRNVPMYRTTILLAPAGRLHGHMVVSMRPFHAHDVERAREATRPYIHAHGEPIAWGDPAALGILDIDAPDEGDAVPLAPLDVPVFWGCGVTTQAVAMESRIPLVITHEPGQMFVTALRHEQLHVGRSGNEAAPGSVLR